MCVFCYLTFNEISVGMISSLNEAHSCFIDHEMLPIISLCLPSLVFDLYTTTLELLSPKFFLYKP